MIGVVSVAFRKSLANGTRLFTPVLSTCRTICSKHTADVSRPKPFPYETKDYNFPYTLFDDTEDRFNQNSKIIIVEGPIASGKTDFCKKLADELDMLYMPPANMDMLYKIGDFDFRSLDSQFSTENMKCYDEKTFNMNPNHLNTAIFQIRMFELRFSSYIDAVAHMLSTGQGVVLQRSPFSDYVFIEALEEAGYVTKRVKDIYREISKSSLPPIIKPHLVIYLDIPISVVKENIKKRNNPWEVNSPVYKNDVYLRTIEETYKNQFLPAINVNSELLVYNWSEGGDHEVVVEDIERIDFENYDHFSLKSREWRELSTRGWNILRTLYADNKSYLMDSFNLVERHDAPELLYTPEELLEFNEIVQNTPELRYPQGYDPNKFNVLFKMAPPKKDRKIYLYWL